MYKKCIPYWLRIIYRQVPIIAKLHAMRKRLRIFEPIFEKDICDKLTTGPKLKQIKPYQIYKDHGGSHGRKI